MKKNIYKKTQTAKAFRLDAFRFGWKFAELHANKREKENRPEPVTANRE